MKNQTLFSRYPLSSVLLYNGVTVAHFLLGGLGMAVGYGSWAGWLLAGVYVAAALVEMYIFMPIKVCRNCVYVHLDNSLCVAGLNVVSRRIARRGNIKDFADRAAGVFCPNNLYLAALGVPIVAIIPALIMHFSLLLLALLVVLTGLLLFRFFFIFTRVACVHCRARGICPNAKAMGLGK